MSFNRYNTEDSVISSETVVRGLFPSDNVNLTSVATSSTQASSSQFYLDVYNAGEVVFSIEYAHISGSGSAYFNSNVTSSSPTKVVYGQYRNLIYGSETATFQIGGSTVNSFYVINVARARYKETMDAGNWELSLSGSNGITTFIDDSGKKFSDTVGKAGRLFYVVSGSLNLGQDADATVLSTTASNGEGYGLFYPDRGIIVLNAKAIGNVVGNVGEVGFQNTGSLQGGVATTHDAYNHKLLYYAIKKGGDFEARRTENVSTQHFFVRATNREFNYSNNPTYLAADGTFTETSFNTDPQTYITTVGLLNDSNELVAIAKTSQPIVKSFDKEVLIKVKLSF